MKNLQRLRQIQREKLDVEEIVRLAEVLDTGRWLRWACGLTLAASFSLLLLHALHLIELPPVALNTVNYSIPLTIVGIFAKHVGKLWSRPRSRVQRSQK